MKRERIAEIAELLDKRGKLTLEQLAEYFPGVSQMTLRRDLLQLEKEGKIIRVRGGAMSVREVQKTSGEPYTKKTTIHTDEKIVIAQKAAGLIDEGSSIFIDGGSTALYLAKEMPERYCRCNRACKKEKRGCQLVRRSAYQGEPVHGIFLLLSLFYRHQL